KSGVGRTKLIEILRSENDPVVGAVGKRGLQVQTVQHVGRICRAQTIDKARIKPLKLADIAAAQCQPPIVALVLILRVEAEVGEYVCLRKHRGRETRKTLINEGMHIELPPERAERKRVPAPMRLDRD